MRVMICRSDNGWQESLEQIEPVPGWDDDADSGFHARLPLSVAMLHRSARCPSGVRHLFKRLKAIVASNNYEGVLLFDDSVSRGIEYHLATGPVNSNDHYIEVRADACILQRTIDERRSSINFYLLH